MTTVTVSGFKIWNGGKAIGDTVRMYGTYSMRLHLLTLIAKSACLDLCCARGSGDKLVTRKKEKGSNKLVAQRWTSWSLSGR